MPARQHHYRRARVWFFASCGVAVLSAGSIGAGSAYQAYSSPAIVGWVGVTLTVLCMLRSAVWFFRRDNHRQVENNAIEQDLTYD